MPYRSLNADRIEATLETLYHRIQERFGEQVSARERARDVDPDDIGGI